MINKKEWRGKLLGMIIVILPLLIIPSALFAEEAVGNASFVLTIQDNLISLKAKDAPVAEIVKEIGRKMDIEIAGDIPATEKVSMEFENLTFDEAMARLRVDYAYVTGPREDGERIIKVMLLPKSEGDGVSMAASQSASVRVVGDVSIPAAGAVTKVRPPLQAAPEKPKDIKAPSLGPFKFEFSP